MQQQIEIGEAAPLIGQVDAMDELMPVQNEDTSRMGSVPKELQHDQFFTELIQGPTAIDHSRQLPEHAPGLMENETAHLPLGDAGEVTEYCMNRHDQTLFPLLED